MHPKISILNRKKTKTNQVGMVTKITFISTMGSFPRRGPFTQRNMLALVVRNVRSVCRNIRSVLCHPLKVPKKGSGTGGYWNGRSKVRNSHSIPFRAFQRNAQVT